MRRVALVLFSAAFLVGVTTEPEIKIHGTDADADRAMAVAAWAGGDAHASVTDVFNRYGPGGYDGKRQPAAARTPGAILLQSSLILVPQEHLKATMHVAAVAALLAICWMSTRIAGLPAWVGGVGALLLADTAVMRDQYNYGNAAIFVALLIAGGWLLLPSRWAAPLLAAAAALKLWPLMVVAALLVRKETRRVGWETVGWFVAVNAAGLMLPGSSLAGSYRSMVEGAGYAAFGGNMSTASVLGVPVWVGFLLGGLVAALGFPLRVNQRVAAAVVGGLVASPLVWPYYWLAAIPVAFVAAGQVVGYAARKYSNDAWAVEVMPYRDTNSP